MDQAFMKINGDTIMVVTVHLDLEIMVVTLPMEDTSKMDTLMADTDKIFKAVA
jgi:hypothetical protein